MLIADRFLSGDAPVDQGEILARWPFANGITATLVKEGFLAETEGGGYTMGKPPRPYPSLR
jgi:hypothetical protein